MWATLGPWRLQHDADFLNNGNLLVFDNVGHLGVGGGSRVIEFDPESLGIVWEYAGDKRRPLYSEQRSGQQRLPSGNTLIVESDFGRMLEVTPDKRVVWEFLNPQRLDDKIAAILGATRVDPSSLTFLGEGAE